MSSVGSSPHDGGDLPDRNWVVTDGIFRQYQALHRALDHRFVALIRIQQGAEELSALTAESFPHETSASAFHTSVKHMKALVGALVKECSRYRVPFGRRQSASSSDDRLGVETTGNIRCI
jgi:hypothetical protein